jgi:hypothetical protein
LCVGLEQLVDNSKTCVASKDELDLMMELSLQYNNTLLAPASGWRETTGYLQNAATTLLSTKKILSPQRLEQEQQLVVAQPSSLADAPQQSAVAQVKLVVEDEALETEKMRQLLQSSARELFAYLDFSSCVKPITHHRSVLNLPSWLHSSQQVSNLPSRS